MSCIADFKISLPLWGGLGWGSLLLLLASCSTDPDVTPTPNTPVTPVATCDNLIICNEGNWQSDNGQLSYFEGTTGTLTNKWFRAVNGYKLGDTPNDIVQINDTLIAITMNWSNIIQYIHPDGRACGATENIPNNRRMCSDGKYLYVTSYAHKCGTMSFQKGFVAKVDVATKQVVGVCEVGWEPDAIRLYDGRLYVANTGGYAFTEDHDYETTLHVLDAATMKTLRVIDTGCINPYGGMSQAGRYLCINFGGDYYDVEPHTVILDCDSERMHVFDFPSTYNTTDGKVFYTVGTEFSYVTGEYINHIHTIDPETMAVGDTIINRAVTDRIMGLEAPNDIYVSPYTHNLYFTDGRNHATAGLLYGYSTEGQELFVPQKLYISPAHILAVKQ